MEGQILIAFGCRLICLLFKKGATAPFLYIGTNRINGVRLWDSSGSDSIDLRIDSRIDGVRLDRSCSDFRQCPDNTSIFSLLLNIAGSALPLTVRNPPALSPCAIRHGQPEYNGRGNPP